MEKLDSVDKKILAILQTNGRITNAQLAKELSLSPSPTLERVKKLEQAGIIRKYVALVDGLKVNRNTTAFVSVSLDRLSDNVMKTFDRQITQLDEVQECYSIAGEYDYLLKVTVSDLEEYNHFWHHKLSKIKGIHNIKTSFVLTSHKQETALPVQNMDIQGSETGKRRNGSK